MFPLSAVGGVTEALFKGCPFLNHLMLGEGRPPLDEQVKDITDFSTNDGDDGDVTMSGGPGGTEKRKVIQVNVSEIEN